jgi:hypothetical protein
MAMAIKLKQCEHDQAEKEAACADGMCPFCAAARAELAQIEIDLLKTRIREQAAVIARFVAIAKEVLY